MVFDSPIIRDYKQNHVSGELPLNCSTAFHICFNDTLVGERLLVERILGDPGIPRGKIKQWRSTFLQFQQEGNFLGAWFEVRLYDWLCKRFSVSAGEKMGNKTPDFLITINGFPVIVEAMAIQVHQKTADVEKWTKSLDFALREIKKPYWLNITYIDDADLPPVEKVIKKIKKWLKSGADKPLLIKGKDKSICVEFVQTNSSGHLLLSFCSNMFRIVDGKGLYNKLSDKYPRYASSGVKGRIFAYYLGDYHDTSEEVIAALFGERRFMVAQDGSGRIDVTTDTAGILYENQHNEDSDIIGFLVFKSVYDQAQKCLNLRSTFIQNPFCKSGITPADIGADHSFAVIENNEDAGHFEMGYFSGLDSKI